jgi:hypothetical protein
MSQKLDVGAALSRVFDLYGQQAAVVLPAAAIVYLVPGVAAALIGGGAAAVGLTFLVSVLSVIAGFWYQGVVVRAVVDMEDGRRDFTVGELFRSTAPFVGALLVAGLLAGVGIAIGLVLLVVPGLVLLTWWAVIVPVIVLERSDVLGAFRRSRQLVAGNGWRVFGIIVLLAIVQAIISAVLREIALAISDGRLSDALGTYLGSIVVAPAADQGRAAADRWGRARGPRGRRPDLPGRLCPAAVADARAAAPGRPVVGRRASAAGRAAAAGRAPAAGRASAGGRAPAAGRASAAGRAPDWRRAAPAAAHGPPRLRPAAVDPAAGALVASGPADDADLRVSGPG